MATLLQRLRGERSIASIEDYVSALNDYGWWGQSVQTSYGAMKTETVGWSFDGLARQAFQANGVVFSCMLVRQLVFSSVRFRWQRLRDGKPSDMFGTPDLRILESPAPGETTQDMLNRVIQDADLAGNAYHVADTPLTRLGGDVSGSQILRLRPDWMNIIVAPRQRMDGQGGQAQLGWRRVGYVYTEGGQYSGNDPVFLGVDEVSHFAPIPDPLASFRGMSWLTPVIREIENDSLMNRHKRKFFENGGTPNLIVKHAEGANKDDVLAWSKRVNAGMGQLDRVYKTLNLYPGADATVVGANMKEIDFKAVQGAGETRIAAAAGVPPVIVGLSEGLEAATYSNYAQARRRFADGTMHPLWQNTAGSLAPLLPNLGPDVRLWYDADDIPFLREDEKDAAEINKVHAETITSLVNAGYTPDSVVKAVNSGDFRLLEHTGLYSVQLQKAGAEKGDSAARLLQQMYLSVGRVITAEEARQILKDSGTLIDPPIDLDTLHANLPPQPVTQDTQAPAEEPKRSERALENHVHLPASMTNLRVEGAHVHIPEQLPPEVHVDVAPAAAPEVRVENAISVEPTPVEVRNEVRSPDIVVEQPDITVEPPNVYVEAPEVRVEAPQVDVTVEAPEVTVEAPNVTVEARADAPAVNVTVEPTPIEVSSPVEVTVQPADTVVRGPKRTKVERDAKGEITGTTYEYDEE